MTVTEWMEEGIKAYTRGDLAEARRCWLEALRVEPENGRARAYLDLLVGNPSPATPGSGANGPGTEPAPAVESPWDEGRSRAGSIELADGRGLDLAVISDEAAPPVVPAVAGTAGQRPPTDVDVCMQGARELFALGDFSGSLEMIERILKVDPFHAEARAYLDQNEATLIAMYESTLGSPHSVPRLAIKPEEVTWLNLDHRAGFLLAQIDGKVSFDDLFALSGVPRLDTARILAALLQEGVIATS